MRERRRESPILAKQKVDGIRLAGILIATRQEVRRLVLLLRHQLSALSVQTIMSALGPSLASAVKNSRGLYGFLKPLADKYANLAGYRQHGLKYDDILIEENDVVQKVN